jgi:transposase-like protein
VPGEEFDSVVEILRLDQEGRSRREIAGLVDIPISTVQNVIERRGWYIERIDQVDTNINKELITDL